MEKTSFNKETKIYIAGHRGMVGRAIYRTLQNEGYQHIVGKTSGELDLRNQAAVEDFFAEERPEIVIDAAAKVGGILANSTDPYPFLMNNMLIQNNLIDAAHRFDVKKFIFLGSSCIYPKLAEQPLKESSLLTAPLEPTNEWYAIAKISGVKACQAIRQQYGKDFISLMPTNLYGTFDNFDLNSSHVLPAMLRKFHDAKLHGAATVTLWGTGSPLREFLFVDDMADAVLFALEHSLPDHLYNVGTGQDLSIKDLAQLIKSVVGFDGDIVWDTSKPNGTPRKLMDVSKLSELGWTATTALEEGIRATYAWYKETYATLS